MRRVYALLGLVRKYGVARVDEVAATALAFEMHEIRRLQRMLAQGVRPSVSLPAASPKVIPLARYLRPASQYALPLASREIPSANPTQGEE
jgi:hypothetical protein